MRSLLILAIMALPVCAADDDRPVYHWKRDVQLPELTETQLISIPLDTHFFLNTRDGYPDLRLHDDHDAAVGFSVRQIIETKTRTTRKTWSAYQASAKVDATAGLQIELELRPSEAVPEWLKIVTPLRDFEHQVRVESSSDGINWIPNGTPAVIFDYSRFVDARNDLIPIAPTNDRRFRLTIEDLTADQVSQLVELNRRLRGREERERTERSTVDRRPFRIDWIEFQRYYTAEEPTGETRLVPCSVANFSVKENKTDHQTIVSFETQVEPVTKLKIVTAVENFSRTAAVEVEKDAHGQLEWRRVGQGTLTRFAIGTIKRDQLVLEIPETRIGKYRIVIENQDSPPIEVSAVEVSGPAYELTFLASPNKKLELEYGSADARPGRFDIAALDAALRQSQQSVTAGLGAPQENRAAPVGGEVWKPWNDSRVLTAIIVLMALILGGVLFRAGKQLNEASR